VNILAANWKMHKTREETRAFFRRFLELYQPTATHHLHTLIAPPYTSIETALGMARNTPLWIGAQNVHQEEQGAYTGEISLPMLQDLGVHFVIVGHSERRKYFHETDELIARKLHRVLDAGLWAILCVGETLQEREAGEAERVVQKQVEAALTPLDANHIPRLIVAYEPIWAIGTGRTATREAIAATHAMLRRYIEAPILYGGSVKPGNAAELFAQPDVDGGLIGGASLDARSFSAIMRAAASAAGE
jgi:triosephosphate isomerase